MTSAMTRPDDTVRTPRLNGSEMDEHETENGMPESGGFLPIQNDDSPYPDEGESRPTTALGDAHESTSKPAAGPKTLSPEETIELARNAVESGIQDTKRSLAGSEAVTDVVKPKLTIDLGHSHIARIPEPVVDLIKDEVERYVEILTSNCHALVLRCLIGYGVTTLNYTDHYKGCLCQITNFSISHIALLSARICAISTLEQTTSVNFQKEYVKQ